MKEGNDIIISKDVATSYNDLIPSLTKQTSDKVKISSESLDLNTETKVNFNITLPSTTFVNSILFDLPFE